MSQHLAVAVLAVGAWGCISCAKPEPYTAELQRMANSLTKTVLPVILLPWPTQLSERRLYYVSGSAQKVAIACAVRLQSLERERGEAATGSRRIKLVTAIAGGSTAAAIAAMEPIRNESAQSTAKAMIGVGGGLVTATLAGVAEFGDYDERLSAASRRIGEIRTAVSMFSKRWLELVAQYPAPEPKSADGTTGKSAPDETHRAPDGGVSAEAGVAKKRAIRVIWPEEGPYEPTIFSAVPSSEGLQWFLLNRDEYFAAFDIEKYPKISEERQAELQVKLGAEVSVLLESCSDHLTVADDDIPTAGTKDQKKSNGAPLAQPDKEEAQ